MMDWRMARAACVAAAVLSAEPGAARTVSFTEEAGSIEPAPLFTGPVAQAGMACDFGSALAVVTPGGRFVFPAPRGLGFERASRSGRPDLTHGVRVFCLLRDKPQFEVVSDDSEPVAMDPVPVPASALSLLPGLALLAVFAVLRRRSARR